MTDGLDRLAASLADWYVIELEVGSGGMSVVYLAHDVKHDRKVAVKVLRPELAAVLGHERFLREIRTTAGLRHPHIVPLYDSGEVDGQLFYVMPLVEGESLRDRIDREKQLPVDDAVQIAREVADALSYAHAQGVVHRDVKPANILLESGHAVVTDFGIARAIGAAGGGELTQTGVSVGTPMYMSPEQAQGTHDVDGRSDLYSLGCVLYEMLAGQPPFVGATAESVLRQHLTFAPAPVTDLRSSVPRGVAGAIARALAKAPADRYATAMELEAALAKPEKGPGLRMPLGRALRRWRLLGLAAVMMLVAAVAVRWWPIAPPAGERPMLAVLPFENLGAPEDEYFADGLAEELTSRLAQISALGVISRTSAMRYKATDKSLRQIAGELGVAYVLEGTVRTDRGPDGSGEVRVTPQLIRATDDTHLWADRYTASLTPGEIFSVQATIAEQVVTALGVALLGPERAALEQTPTDDPEAYDAYLLGRFYWNKRTAPDLERAAGYFARAVAADAAFAEAHVGLADTYALYGYYAVPGVTRPEAYRRAEDAARRAIALDPDLAAAHASLGNILMYGSWAWEAAENAFQRAMALDPEYPVARYWYAELLTIVGRLDEAIAQAERAVALDPGAPVAHHLLATALAFAGRVDEAIERERVSLSIEPNFSFSHDAIAWLYAVADRPEEAEREFVGIGWPEGLGESLVRHWNDPTLPPELVTRMDAFVRHARAQYQYADAAVLGGLYMAVGATDQGFAEWEQAFAERSEVLVFNIRHPGFDRIRSDPRYADLMRRMGLRP